jgi:hypothetical protein
MGRRGQGKRRLLAVLPLDHQVLPGVVTRRLAGRGAQAHTPDIATDVDAFADLARQLAHRQLSRRQHAIPQHTVFQRLGDAGVELTMVAHFAGLLRPGLPPAARRTHGNAVAAACGQS